jgi:hypothetical protein
LVTEGVSTVAEGSVSEGKTTGDTGVGFGEAGGCCHASGSSWEAATFSRRCGGACRR